MIATNVVGCRVVYRGDVGTIRYVGPVPPAPGQWYGVEWDNAARGKHDGMQGGVRYFTCQHPTAGSFVRQTAAGLSLGTSFIDALVRKYWVGETGQLVASIPAWAHENPILRPILDNLKCPSPKDIATGPTSQNLRLGDTALPIEACGWVQTQARMAHIDQLAGISLANAQVASLDHPKLIHKLCPLAEELNLSSNLLTNWAEVTELLAALPQLRTLRLNYNRLQSRSFIPASLNSAGAIELRTLSLNHTGLQWEDVVPALAALPHLETLSMGFNGLVRLAGNSQTLTDPLILKQQLPALRYLTLEHNQLSDWHDLCILGHLPELQTLDLRHNQLSEIAYPSSASTLPAIPFPKLTTLVLNENVITQWSSIDQLDQFPTLHTLRCTANPVVASLSADEARTQLVCRIGKLISLNGSPLYPRERLDLELYYMRQVAEQSSPAQAIDTIAIHHPRYPQLVAKHGLPAAALVTAKGQNRIKSRLVQLTINLVASLEDQTPQRAVKKGLLLTLSVRKLRALCCKLVRTSSPNAALYLRDQVAGDTTYLEDDTRELGYYDPTNGDTILVVAS
ncbi:hypothetical protein H4R35_006700 [Dimargaris xerosporica]|nr:hypothetical protein H4R35_006700 [Dimargaris xerosporica]